MSSISRHIRGFLFLVVAGALAHCGRDASPLPLNPTPPGITNAVISLTGPPGVLVGAGDIGFCGTSGAAATAQLLDRLGGMVFTTGDNAYVSGSVDEFQRCYEPTWGRHRSRTHPSPGNHDYESGGGAYYSYFGASAGPGGAGYYAYFAGPWRVIALNSEIPSGQGSPQMDWLSEELATNRIACTAVYWHRPLFSSGRHGDNPDMRDVWRTLYANNVDLIINGHDHNYERFAPQDPDGRPDPARGIREFIVGTGGAPLYAFPNIHGNSEARGSVWGVAVFTLASGGYQYEFVPVAGESFRDSGSGSCH